MISLAGLAAQLGDGAIAGPSAFAVALLGGLVAGFGPCTLPMLPAVFGYVTGTVAGEGGVSQRRVLALSGVFVLGTSLVFAVIGALAGAIGRAVLFGAWASYVVAAVCLALGLHMLGLIDLRLDVLNRFLPQQRPRGRGLAGALTLGMLFGLVATPCSTPILAGIATIAAARGSAVQGAALLFVYGLGKGVPLLILGFASGSLAKMRPLSRAAGALTKAGGIALLGVAAYLVWTA